jgi:hypothetical protein
MIAQNRLGEPEMNKTEPSSLSSALVYKLEHKASTLELQGYREPVEI